MKVALDWLQEWIDLPGLEALDERLTVGGLEIEEVIRRGPDLSAVRVGAVLQREAHPDADRLSLCQVDIGEEEPLAIVCGAPNVAAGQKVAVATHGTTLPDGLRIKRSKIRGVKSNGMICSRRELGLGEDAAGILVLDEDAPVGAPLPQVLPSQDVVLDIAITPNRGDWVSMLGMAREVRAHFGGELRQPPTECEESAREAAADLRVAIEDAEGCLHYAARVVHDVRVAASPDWLVERLEAAGLRSVNNVVDVTNLVMLEFGQPLHAFDLDKLRGGVVKVRAAEADEKIVSLDGQTRQLGADDLVIADAERAIAIAGVMGGSETEVGEGSTALLIESAHFHPGRIRRSARRLGLATDASYRFERGVDPAGVGRAADRAARLIRELAGGEVARGRVEARGAPPARSEAIQLRPERANRLLGTELSADRMAELLGRVDVDVRREGGALWATPPSYRGDLHLPEDLIEEIARIHGYDRIEPSLPEGALRGVSEPPGRALAWRARDALVGAGLTEVMTFSAAAPEDLDALGLPASDPRREALRIVNPIQASEPVLRTTLVPAALRAARDNLSRQADALRFFELSRTFRARASGELPEERLQAVAVVAGAEADGFWERADVPLFFRAKGIAEFVLQSLGAPARFRAGSDEPYLHPGVSGEYQLDGQRVASLGELHPETAARFGIESPLALVVLDLEALGQAGPSAPVYEPVSRHPRVRRDLAVLVDSGIGAGELLAAIPQAAGGALHEVQLFDRYEGQGVADGKISLAFRLDFQRVDRTLTDAEVNKAVEKVVRMLTARFGGELR